MIDILFTIISKNRPHSWNNLDEVGTWAIREGYKIKQTATQLIVKLDDDTEYIYEVKE